LMQAGIGPRGIWHGPTPPGRSLALGAVFRGHEVLQLHQYIVMTLSLHA
jgi:hypothetical protein